MEKKRDSVDVIKRECAQSLPGVDVGAATVTGRIRRTNFHLNRNAEEVFNGFNTTGASFDVLAALYAAGPPYQMTPTDFYRGHVMSSAGVTARAGRWAGGSAPGGAAPPRVPRLASGP